MRRLFTLPILFAAIFLAGCGSTPDGDDDFDTAGILTPMPGEDDLPTAAVIDAVEEFIAETGAPRSTLYQIGRYDLNGDGKREALVLFKNPYGYWCDRNGCTMLILEAQDDHFTLASSVQPVRAPLAIGPKTHKGWRDIIVHVSGRWTRTKDVALTFDGRKYPEHPDNLPAYARSGDEANIFEQ